MFFMEGRDICFFSAMKNRATTPPIAFCGALKLCPGKREYTCVYREIFVNVATLLACVVLADAPATCYDAGKQRRYIYQKGR